MGVKDYITLQLVSDHVKVMQDGDQHHKGVVLFDNAHYRDHDDGGGPGAAGIVRRERCRPDLLRVGSSSSFSPDAWRKHCLP